MPRVKRGVTAHRRHKRLIARASGFRQGRKNIFRLAKQALLKAGQNAYRDRRVKKREFRSLWITRLNAAVRGHGLTYSQFIAKANAMNLGLNRKVLSQLAIKEPDAFAKIVEKVKTS